MIKIGALLVAMLIATGARADCFYPRDDSERVACAMVEASEAQVKQLQAIAEQLEALRRQQQWDAPLLDQR